MLSNIITQIHLICNLQNKNTVYKGDHVSFKPAGAKYNDVVGRIRPEGLVFDTCAIHK